MTDAPEPTPATPPSALSRIFSEGRAGVAALAISILALVITVAPYASGGDFGGRVRAYLLQHPEVLQEVSNELNERAQQQQIVDAREHADRTTALLAANPSLLGADSRDPTFGPADAKVTVIEFFDFRCPGCKSTAPEVLRLIQAHPDVRFVFKDWPILDGGPDGPSHFAARAAQAAHRQGKYLPVFQALMAEPDLSGETVGEILSANGVSLPEAQAAMGGSEITRHLSDIQVTATALKLVGTPTFIVNGRAMPTISPEALDAAIRAAKAG